ncbi:sel1 repeat family protein [Vreelandella andesensis]|uniref:Sel1 repeat family protein n=1 Tax=Vreelandella andesensis TaxID=447567 RepID=A0A433KTA7_9GAMM|nr:tetratricopeptide repeat protein [Halomonas andesensis]RUR32752.1 sel1 repeat family protein [Halomonas andesensis]
MRPISKVILFVGALFLGTIPAFGQSFNKGLDAYESGDYATALEHFEPLAEQENANAEYHLGMMYIGGKGIPRSSSEGIRWTRRAAEQGHADAQSRMGLAYLVGMGVILNLQEGFTWYQQAAEQGHDRHAPTE